MNEWKYPQKHCILELKGTYRSFSPNPNFIAAETEVQSSNTVSEEKQCGGWGPQLWKR